AKSSHWGFGRATCARSVPSGAGSSSSSTGRCVAKGTPAWSTPTRMANGSRRMCAWHHATSDASKCFGMYTALSYWSRAVCTGPPAGPPLSHFPGGSPRPHAAHVDVNKVRGRIVAHAAQPEAEGGLPQRQQGSVGEPHVDRHGLHVEAHAGDAATLAGEHRVRGGRAVARDHLVRRRCVERHAEPP